MSEKAAHPHGTVSWSVLERADTLMGAVEELVERLPAHDVLVFLDRSGNERRMSLSALWTRAKAVQAAIAERGFEPGDRAVVALPTGAELVAAYLGVMAAGGIPALAATPFNRVADPATYTQMLGNILGNASARCLYCEDEVADLLRDAPDAARAGVAILRSQDVRDGGSAPPTARRSPEDVATLQYSSGTTGPQKGVQLTHRAMLAYTRSLRDGLALQPDDVHVNWAPLYHDMGLFGAFLLPLLCGSPSVLIPTADFVREPALWLRAIHRYRGAVSWAPNFAYALCAQRIPDADLEGLDLSSWRVALNASEPVLPVTVERFLKRFEPLGFRRTAMSAAWGLAEVVMVGTLDPVDEPPRVDTVDRQVLAREGRAEPTSGEGLSLVATGKCLPGFEMEVRDADRRPLGDRHVGDVWLRSGTLFAGYRNDAALTRKIVVDGWINSGDRGYIVDGHLYYVSRAKDLIIVGGENHAPHDIEDAINRVPGVRQGCAVAFGITNPERGTEALAAVVETREQEPRALEDLRRAIRREVLRSSGLGIRHLLLVPPGGVSKTTSGKLARSATRLRHAEALAGGR
jgi:fatty-acyl-CoA synthase